MVQAVGKRQIENKFLSPARDDICPQATSAGPMLPLTALDTFESTIAPHGLHRRLKAVAAYAACNATKSVELAHLGVVPG